MYFVLTFSKSNRFVNFFHFLSTAFCFESAVCRAHARNLIMTQMRQRFALNKTANKITSDLAFASQFIKKVNNFNLHF